MAMRLGTTSTTAAAHVSGSQMLMLRETSSFYHQKQFISWEQQASRQCSNKRLVVTAGKGGSDGVFAPIVVLVRNIIGAKRFNLLRGKGIALHSQVITEFCKSVGADNKVRQGLIRVAKKNGEKLGFLA